MKRVLLNAVLVAIIATVVLLAARRRDPIPDRNPASSPASASLSAEMSAAIANGDLLVRGAMDYVVVPFDWKLVDREGKEQPIPKEPGTRFHRLPANEALLATDGTPPDRGESMMFAALHEKGPVTTEMLDRYAEQLVKAAPDGGAAKMVAAKHMFKHEETGDLRGKVVVARPPADGRVEIHYLITDRARHVWQLVYVTRRENADKWRALLADLD